MHMDSKPAFQDPIPEVEGQPKYEADDGPLTDEQDRWIREKSSATNVSDDEFTERLF
jgi:hypothetical protein